MKTGLNRALLAFAVAFTTLAHAQAPALRAFNNEKVSAEEIESILGQVRIDSRARTSVGARYTTVTVIGDFTTYYFTNDKQPAHPAVVRATLATKDGERRPVYDGLYAGDEAAYKKLLAGLEESNKRMAALWGGPADAPRSAPRTALATSEYLRSNAARTSIGKPTETSEPGFFQMHMSAMWVKQPPEGSVVVFEFENGAKGGAPTFVEQPFVPGKPSLAVKSVEYPCARDQHVYKIVARIYEDPARSKLLGTHEQAVTIGLPKSIWDAMRLKECE